jgi:MFS transporter, DHA2 family, methylenomycin A resistance protein
VTLAPLLRRPVAVAIGEHSHPALTARQRGVVVAAGAANALIFLDQTSVTVALPAIQRELHSSAAELHWILGAYLLVLAALVAGSGRLADLYGRRRLFLVGVAAFGLGSLACAAAPSTLALIGARLAQGAGAALMQPLALAHATGIMPPERRGWAIGVLASAGTTCLLVGPLLGGLLTEVLGWRWIFVANVPIVALALALGLRYLPESRDPQAPALDVPGLVLLTAGLAAIVAGLLHLQEWATGVAVGVLALGVLALGAFVAVERRSARPLLPLGLLQQPEVAGSVVALVAIQGAVLGVTVYLVLYLQNGLGLNALRAGLALLPAALWTPLLSTTTGRLADRHGERRLVGGGLLLAAAGLTMIGVTAAAGEVHLMMVGLVVFGVARPLVFTPASTGPLDAIPATERGLASGLVTESRQLGAVLGVAALGSIVAAYNVVGGSAGASATGLRAGMLTAAAASLLAGAVALAALPTHGAAGLRARAAPAGRRP